MGDTKGAELDEFKVLKAQMDQRYGGKKPQNTKRTRKVSDRTMEDYNKLVEADTSEDESRQSAEPQDGIDSGTGFGSDLLYGAERFSTQDVQ